MRPLRKYIMLLALSGLIAGMPLMAQDHGSQIQRQDRDHDRNRNRDRDNHRYRDYDRDHHRGGLYFQFGTPYRPYPRNYYSQGYNSLYDIGYRDGYNLGRSDFVNGFGYDPYSYTPNGGVSYRNGFVAGYRVGYGY